MKRGSNHAVKEENRRKRIAEKVTRNQQMEDVLR